MLNLPAILIGAVARAVADTVRLPSNDAPPAQAERIAAQAVTELQRSPAVQEVVARIEHATNAEPWYQSRVTWGAIVSIGTGVAGIFGVVTSPEDAEAIIAICMAAGTAIGGAITLYGRWAAKKPLGS